MSAYYVQVGSDRAQTSQNAVSAPSAGVCQMRKRDQSTPRLPTSAGLQVGDCFRIADDAGVGISSLNIKGLRGWCVVQVSE
jgi:hypothetical protein